MDQNTNNSRETNSSSKLMTAGMCVVASVVMHIIVVVMLCIRLIATSDDARIAEDEDIQAEEMVIAIKLADMKPLVPQPPISPPENAPLTPQELKALRELRAKTPDAEKLVIQPKPEIKPENVQQFARTTDDQLSGKSEDAVIQGERDTIEASNAGAVASAPNRISVKGETPKNGEHETVDTTFQDGVLEHMNRGVEESKPQINPPSEKVTNPEKLAELDQESDDDIDQEEMKSSVEATNELGDALEKRKLATTNKEHKEFIDTQKKVAINEELLTAKNIAANESKGLEELRKTIANNQLDPDAIKQETEEEKKESQKSQPETQPETLPNTAENKRASDSAEKGFRSEAKAKVMEGSISRRSKIASKNVKATPVGKYMAKISKIVEKEWQRRMMMHADLVQPGTLRVGFMVNEGGKLINYRIISKSFGSENQNSLTFQALGSAKLPVMPQAVKESQGGDPLEFIYSFNFQ